MARILGDFLCVNGDLTRLSLYENEPTEVPAGLGELLDVQEMRVYVQTDRKTEGGTCVT